MANANIRPLYSCLVYIAGSRDNSVYLPSVTAAEIAVLRALHGGGAVGPEPVIDVKATGKGVERSDAQERARIGARYRAPGAANGVAILNSLYGIGNQLPLEYEAATPVWDDTEVPEDEKVVTIAPEGPITSVPEPAEPPAEPPKKKKTESTLLDD